MCFQRKMLESQVLDNNIPPANDRTCPSSLRSMDCGNDEREMPPPLGVVSFDSTRSIFGNEEPLDGEHGLALEDEDRRMIDCGDDGREMAPPLEIVSFDSTMPIFGNEEPLDGEHGLALEGEDISMSDSQSSRSLCDPLPMEKSGRSCVPQQPWLVACRTLDCSDTFSATNTSTEEQVATFLDRGERTRNSLKHCEETHTIPDGTREINPQETLPRSSYIPGTPTTLPSDDVHMLAGWADMLVDSD